ncbi:MAG: HD domain-containing phosphohydrolase [Candidatus Omnitrophota bacterium]
MAHGGSRDKTKVRIHRAYDQLKTAYREFKESHLEMIFRMALMAEYRDPATGVHLVRMADYSAILAGGMGLEPAEIEIIRYASPMHDIGKIVLPDSILKKEGKLTDEEREIIQAHPEVGSQIFKLSKSPIMKACGVIALSHHERFDGTGYPGGLKGAQIPLYGRIVGLADCFDALTSKRPYKEAFDFDVSVGMIIENAVTHFDPSVVMAFARNKDKIRAIWEANRDIEDFLEKEMERRK